ncbi:hypothetical protein BDZ89DRAFT_1140439 [Hymenopellis radicata]|nr:hypothetical protein BDZ89DRAFT_1140439 [Hymenopellis radicata]
MPLILHLSARSFLSLQPRHLAGPESVLQARTQQQALDDSLTCKTLIQSALNFYSKPPLSITRVWHFASSTSYLRTALTPTNAESRSSGSMRIMVLSTHIYPALTFCDSLRTPQQVASFFPHNPSHPSLSLRGSAGAYTNGVLNSTSM